jgi:hypothetical protein
MRGDDQQSGDLFSYLSPEQRVPADHPLRAICVMTDGHCVGCRHNSRRSTPRRVGAPEYRHSPRAAER